MQWNRTKEIKNNSDWHPWFAWFPVVILMEDELTDYCHGVVSKWVWWEYIDRRILPQHLPGVIYDIVDYAPLGTHTKLDPTKEV